MTLGPQFQQFKDEWEGDSSMEITAGAAAIVNARGGWSPIGGERHVETARHLLNAVDSAPVEESPVFSGHRGQHGDFKPGDDFDIPLMSTSSDRKVAEGFAGDESPTMYRFLSHRSIPINRQERLVSGTYKVDRIGDDGVIDLSYRDKLPRIVGNK